MGAAAFLAYDARAETPEEKGLAIAIEADKRDLGWGDFEADGEMVLKDKGGRESRRGVPQHDLRAARDIRR